MHATRSRSTLTRAAACIGLLATAAAVHGQTLELYVDDDAPIGGDGLSWNTAFRSLNDAIDRVQADISDSAHLFRVLKIAQGRYTPASQNQPFRLLSGTTMLGGFAGIGAPNPNARNSAAFISVLSGDVLGDDHPDFANRSDNVRHVVVLEAESGGVLDGLTIEGGHAANGDVGGGILADQHGAHLVVRNCVLRDNFASQGGGIASYAGVNLVMTDCLIEGNRAWNGGGALVTQSSIDRCRFVGNEANEGGGVTCASRRISISNSEFSGNRAPTGAAMSVSYSVTNISNCTFRNWGADLGNGVFVNGLAEARIFGSIFSGDVPQTSVGSMQGRLLLVRNLFENGVESGLASGFIPPNYGNFAGSARFADPLGLDGLPGTTDDVLRLQANSLAIDAAATDELVFPWLIAGVDLTGLPRVHDDMGMPNRGTGSAAALDIGAYEFQGTSCRADHDGDSVVNVPDIFAYLSDWFASRLDADFDRDRVVEVSDIFAFLAAWFAGC